MNQQRILAMFGLAVCLSAVNAIFPVSMYSKRVMTPPETAEHATNRRLRTAREYQYKTMMVEQRIDNFGWGSDDTYKEKVLYSDKHWEKDGPILLYAGNEGEIELFVQNSGLLWDLEAPLKGLVMFAEHRYYGESLPFGNVSYKSRENLAYFTADQAMADYAMLIRHVKTELWPEKASNSKVIVFGGSYGGMLASWMRMKYPDVFDGAISSSAPIWSFTWPCDSYARVVTQDFIKHGSENCRNNIAASWGIINKKNETAEGIKDLVRIFKVCNGTVDATALKMYVDTAFSTVAMVNYPYETDFLAPLPPWPIKVMCEDSGLNEDLTGDENKLLEGVASAIGVYYNYTGSQGDCVVIDTNSGDTAELGYQGWDFQTCTEMTIPFCNTGVTDMFEKSDWSDEGWAEQCKKNWYGVSPNLKWTDVSYWGKNIETASNILFSNGLLDPWSAGGVMKSLSPYQPIVIIPDGAHHLDLRPANAEFDTAAVKAAREIETSWIMKWIQENPAKVADHA